MLICLDCYCLFEEPKHYTETHGLDSPPYERWSGCSRCGGAYVEAHECIECSEYITTDYIKTKSGDRICSDCYSHYELGDED